MEQKVGGIEPRYIIQSVMILIPSALMVGTAVSFLRVRLKKKETQFKKIIRIMGGDPNETTAMTSAVRDEYAAADYRLPVIFATLISLVGFTYLFFGADLLASEGENPILLLNSIDLNDDVDSAQIRWQNLVVMTMAFVGAYVWSAQNIIRRLITGDLTPTIYYSTGMRMIYASFLSLMLALALSATPFDDAGREILPVVAFLTGMLPDQALIFIRSKSKVFGPSPENQAAALPLDMIEGINGFHKSRLSEVGIDNAQNLAESSIIDLILKTPFNPLKLIDWIAQAKLYVYFPKKIHGLREIGLRTIFDYKAACAVTDQIQEIADQTQTPDLTIRLVYQQALDDPSLERLYHFRTQLAALDGGMMESTEG